MACFRTLKHNPVVAITVDFDLKTDVAAKDCDSVSKKSNVEVNFIFYNVSIPVLLFLFEDLLQFML